MRSESKSLRWFYLPLVLFLAFRIAVLVILYRATGGSEFTSDLWVYELGLKPFSVLTFSAQFSDYSQPPLFPLMLAPFALPFSLIFNEFLASRISFTCFELIAFFILARYLALSDEISLRNRAMVLAIFSVSPLGFMTGAVMRQEEAVVAIFVTAVLLAVKLGSIKGASLLTFLGMLAGKILFGIVFFPLLLIAKNKSTIFYWGILPAILVHAGYALAGYALTGVIPFIDFAPSDTQFCASPFTLILYFHTFSGQFVKWLSLSVTGIVLVFLWKRFSMLSQLEFPSVMIITFCILFLCFSHVNTEYHIFVLPLLALIPYATRLDIRKSSINILHAFLAIGTWGYGIIYGVRAFAEEKSGYSRSKEIALNLYEKVLGFIPIKFSEISLLVLTLVSIFLILIFIYYSQLAYNNKVVSK